MLRDIDFACDDRDALQQTLNELYGYRDDIVTKVLHRCRLNLLTLLLQSLAERSEIASFESAIDIGCNAGIYCRILSDRGFRYVLGIDIADEMIQKAQATFGSNRPGAVVEFRRQTAESLDVERKFDFVLCTEVIEHTEDPARVIHNIKDVLNPGGLAIISLPNRVSLPYLIGWLAHRLRRKVDEVFERHLDYPFYRSIQLFGGATTKVIATDGTNLFWNGPLLRLLHTTQLFPGVNAVNFHASRLWPLKYMAQHFYLIVRKR
jgi:2-polyprenyl-3-methyl-5-hydroxy-6-metoxy-1,4-benzoquinol methylase